MISAAAGRRDSPTASAPERAALVRGELTQGTVEDNDPGGVLVSESDKQSVEEVLFLLLLQMSDLDIVEKCNTSDFEIRADESSDPCQTFFLSATDSASATTMVMWLERFRIR